ncbi:MAG TPA: acyl-CoA dehydrogenase [Pseudomonas sp.]|jgi:alkylation response protein AidB-like acyl-CoA dehydrogenase
MNLNISEEQQMLRDTVARLFATESSCSRVRGAENTGFDRQLWQQLVDLGITTMRAPASVDGGGMTLLDAVLVMEQAGKHLASVPLAESMPVAGLLAGLDTEAAQQLLARIRAGEVVTLAPQGSSHNSSIALPAAHVAYAVLRLEGQNLVAVSVKHAGKPEGNLGADAVVISDATLHRFDQRVIASGSMAVALFQAAVEEWKVLKSAALFGLARQAIELAAEYSRERIQFGKPIGSFQGIAHPLADSLTEIEGAQLLTWHAVWSMGQGNADAAAMVSMAWWWATQSTARAVAKALHTFGGYGVSLEYDIQLYYRRGKGWSLLAGDPHEELDRLAERLWDGGNTALPVAGESGITFGYGPDAEIFAKEVHQFFETHLTDELKAHAHHSVDGYHPEFNRQLADAGLLFPHWPARYGGRDKSPFEMAALQEVFEAFNWQRITAPITNQVAQIAMRFATEQAKDEALPRFASGEALACLGFSEPSCGSDVFAAKTRAVRLPNGNWQIDGQKIFTTAANLAHYCLLLVRTNPEVAKHAGLTLFLVPMDLAGIEIHPVYTLQDERTNITYFSQVEVPDHYRVGAIDGGTAVMAATLELEHSGDQYRLSFSTMFKHAVEWANRAQRNGQPAIRQQDVRRRLAKVAVHTTLARDLCYRSTWAVMRQVPGRAAYGPMSKLFSTEQYHRDAVDLMDLCAPDSLLHGEDGLGYIELGYRQSIGMTIYGGTSEIHRSLIAEQGLKMPRSRS